MTLSGQVTVVFCKLKIFKVFSESRLKKQVTILHNSFFRVYKSFRASCICDFYSSLGFAPLSFPREVWLLWQRGHKEAAEAITSDFGLQT